MASWNITILASRLFPANSDRRALGGGRADGAGGGGGVARVEPRFKCHAVALCPNASPEQQDLASFFQLMFVLPLAELRRRVSKLQF